MLGASPVWISAVVRDDSRTDYHNAPSQSRGCTNLPRMIQLWHTIWSELKIWLVSMVADLYLALIRYRGINFKPYMCRTSSVLSTGSIRFEIANQDPEKWTVNVNVGRFSHMNFGGGSCLCYSKAPITPVAARTCRARSSCDITYDLSWKYD